MDIEKIIKELELTIIPESTIAVNSDFKNFSEYQEYLDNVVLALKRFNAPLTFIHCGHVLGSFEAGNNALEELLSNIKKVGLVEPIYVILMAIPKTFKDRFGLDYFIGDLNTADHEATLPFNAYLNQISSFPEEFVVGYLTASPMTNGALTFSLNDKYIGTKSEEEQIHFFETIKDSLIACGVKSFNGYGSNIVFFERNDYHMQLENYIALKEAVKR